MTSPPKSGLRKPFAGSNKNRLCSMTCGIDNIYKIDRLDTKRFFLKGTKDNLNEKKRSHPEEKSGQGATDLS